MITEIYLIEKPKTLATDIETNKEWLQKVEELGLEFQKNLCEQDKTLIPFYKLRAGEVRMFNILYPEKTSVETYAEDTIPLEVLSIIALAKKNEYFGRIEVWYNYNKLNPILIGYKKSNHGNANEIDNDGIYLLARWGEELKSFTELLAVAKEQYIKEKLAELRAEISKLEFTADKYFSE